MPRLNLPKKRKSDNRKKRDKSKSLIHSTIYNTSRWKKLRIYFLSNNPLCSRCKKRGKLVSATDVHHIVEISNAGEDIDLMKALGFDYNNLEALCKECHIHHHINH